VGVRFSAAVQTGPRGPSSLLYNEYRIIPGGRAAKVCRYPITPSRAEVEGWKKSIAILLLLCAVMARCKVNVPYLISREEYNYAVGDENRVWNKVG